MKYVRILCFADVHSPRYFTLFAASLAKVDLKNVEVVIMAGDIVEKGRVEALKPVIDVLRRHVPSKPVYAVFGNEEYFDMEKAFTDSYPEITWLNDNAVEVEVEGVRLCIVGSRGILSRPTHWQAKHIPGIHEIYRARVRRLMHILSRCREQCDKVILATHYACSYATIKGEPPSIYPYLGYPLIETLPPAARPDIAVHGHAHNAKVLRALVNSVEVHNVAVPARGGVTLLNIAVERRVATS